MRVRLCVGIMFVVVDRFADVVLPLVDLLMLLGRQLAAIGSTVVCCFTIDARLATLDVPGLACRHLTGVNPLSYALLLIFCAFANPGQSCILRTTAVDRGQITAIGVCHLHMVLLLGSEGDVIFPRVPHLLCGCMGLDASSAAVEAGTVTDHIAI